MENAKIVHLYDLSKTIAGQYLSQFTYPWEALDGISQWIREVGPTLDPEKFDQVKEDVWVAKSATIAPTAYLGAPLIIDEDAEIRHCAFIRGSAVVGKGAVVGNSTELKNDIIFDEMDLITRRVIARLENGNVTDEILEEYADPESEKYERMVEEIRKELNFTSLRFNRLDDMLESTGVEPCKLCTYCWNGKE